MQIDEFNIIVIVISGGNGSNRKITLLAAKASKGFLLMFNIPCEIGTLVGWMNLTAASETFAIQLRNNHVRRRFGRPVIIQQGRFHGSFDSSDITIVRCATGVTGMLRATATTTRSK